MDVKPSYSENNKNKGPQTVSAEESSDEEELAVTAFNIDGVKYLKAADNTIYDFKTHEEVGNWNPALKQIE